MREITSFTFKSYCEDVSQPWDGLEWMFGCTFTIVPILSLFDQERPLFEGRSFLPFVFFVPLWLNQSTMALNTLCFPEHDKALKHPTSSWNFPAAVETK
jgi:hypothetical protein